MTASVSATYDLKLNVDETLALVLDNASDPTVQHKLTTHAATLSGTSTPAVTKAFSDDIALVSGVATLDLTSLTGPMSTTVDFTGLKVQLIKLACPSTNTKPITVGVLGITGQSPGTELGYNLFGEHQEEIAQISLPPALRTASVDGSTVDLQVPRSAWMVTASGAVTDGTHVVTMEESDDAAAWGAVAAGDRIGAGGSWTSSFPNFLQKARYIGDKRYVRAVLTVTGSPATGAFISSIWYHEPASIDVMPGASVVIFGDDELADVGALEKNIQFHGTGTETIEVLLVAG